MPDMMSIIIPVILVVLVGGGLIAVWWWNISAKASPYDDEIERKVQREESKPAEHVVVMKDPNADTAPTSASSSASSSVSSSKPSSSNQAS